MTRAWRRFRAMAGIAWAMMFHDKAKLAGGLFGVVFATVLATQQAGTFLGLVNKNTLLARHVDAQVWITPPATEALLPGEPIPERVLYQARAEAGVAWAEPLLYVTSTVTLPQGGSESITLLGVEPGTLHGGPWNVVAGDPRDLAQPDAVFMEDSFRERFGGMNLGSVREIGGRRVHVVGFHWGLIPFGPPFGFTSVDKAREIAGMSGRSQSFVLVGIEDGADAAAVAARLQDRFGADAKVFTTAALERSTVRYVLTRTAIGVTLGTSTLIGLIVGFVIVAIAMFSAVLDNLREFGTLKAIGSKTRDLAKILLVQAFVYAAVGSAIGLTLVGFIARGIRSANLALSLPAPLIAGVPVLMTFICIGASVLALWRLRNLEPGIVFRG